MPSVANFNAAVFVACLIKSLLAYFSVGINVVNSTLIINLVDFCRPSYNGYRKGAFCSGDDPLVIELCRTRLLVRCTKYKGRHLELAGRGALVGEKIEPYCHLMR